MLELQQLIAAGVQPSQARRFLEPLQAACARFQINTAPRIAAFLGQCGHESTMFTALEEDLFYKTPDRIRAVFPATVTTQAKALELVRAPKALGNWVYAGKNGNGDVASGHGWTYRARGAIGVTGLANYAKAERDLNRPYVSQPDLVAAPTDAALTSAHFWHSNDCNRLADAWNIDGITRRVNGPGMKGRVHRDLLSKTFLEALD